MYGEKEERVQELLLDLEDVKEMYKQQVGLWISCQFKSRGGMQKSRLPELERDCW
jgi:hypothetical protein